MTVDVPGWITLSQRARSCCMTHQAGDWVHQLKKDESNMQTELIPVYQALIELKHRQLRLECIMFKLLTVVNTNTMLTMSLESDIFLAQLQSAYSDSAIGEEVDRWAEQVLGLVKPPAEREGE